MVAHVCPWRCGPGGGGGLQERLQEAARPRRPRHRLGGERLPEPHPAEGLYRGVSCEEPQWDSRVKYVNIVQEYRSNENLNRHHL